MKVLRSMLLLVASATALAAASGCSRTGLDNCFVEGETRRCENDCGVGEEICTLGRWSDCDAERVEACENDCGSGLTTCQANTWGPCLNETVQVPCQNPCGMGQADCTDGVVATCRVAPTLVPCENGCGPGEAVCEEGTVLECMPFTTVRSCNRGCEDGEEVCVAGEWVNCNASAPTAPVIDAVVRDFRLEHPDMEPLNRQSDTNITATDLGPDGKPVYLPPLLGLMSSPTTSGRANFDQWYRDVPGVNVAIDVPIQLTASPTEPGVFQFLGTGFFPIDGQGFGNEGNAHNYHFTLEMESRFRYVGGETFRFSGDDDVWVYINGVKVLDLGGVHARLEDTVVLDTVAARTGLRVGEVATLKLFFAERARVESNFEITTTIAEWDGCSDF